MDGTDRLLINMIRPLIQSIFKTFASKMATIIVCVCVFVFVFLL